MGLSGMPHIDRTELRSFLATIVEDPSNLPRLVFADWLEERGAANAAELIRLEIALRGTLECLPAGIPLTLRDGTAFPWEEGSQELINAIAKFPSSNPKFGKLAKRIGELLSDFDQFLPGGHAHSPTDGLHHLTWDRGLITEVVCGSRFFYEALEKWSEWHPIQVVYINNYHGPSDFVQVTLRNCEVACPWVKEVHLPRAMNGLSGWKETQEINGVRVVCDGATGGIGERQPRYGLPMLQDSYRSFRGEPLPILNPRNFLPRTS